MKMKMLGLVAALLLAASVASAQNTAKQQLTLVVNSALVITTTTLPAVTVGQPYAVVVGVSGGVAPYSCAITTGVLPAGVTLGAATAQGCPISGTPTASGSFTFTLTVSDSSQTPAVKHVVASPTTTVVK